MAGRENYWRVILELSATVFIGSFLSVLFFAWYTYTLIHRLLGKWLHWSVFSSVRPEGFYVISCLPVLRSRGHTEIPHCFKVPACVFWSLLVVKCLPFYWPFVRVSYSILDISCLFFFQSIICLLTLSQVSFAEK